jgi:hypothetical protein
MLRIRKPMFKGFGGKNESAHANGIFLKRPSKAQEMWSASLDFGVVGQVISLGCLCCEEKYETGG